MLVDLVVGVGWVLLVVGVGRVLLVVGVGWGWWLVLCWVLLWDVFRSGNRNHPREGRKAARPKGGSQAAPHAKEERENSTTQWEEEGHHSTELN